MNSKYLLIGLITGILFIYIVASVIVSSKTEAVLTNLDSEIQLQNSKLVATAALLSRGAANDEITVSFPECQNADSLAYDSLLSDLDKGLSRDQLQSLQLVFSRCGDAASNRRAAMSMLLEQQVENLNTLAQVKSTFSGKVDAVNDVATWVTLAETEKEISFLFTSLVTNQGDIIDILAGGGSYGSEKVEEIRLLAEISRGKLSELTAEASSLRQEVM